MFVNNYVIQPLGCEGILNKTIFLIPSLLCSEKMRTVGNPSPHHFLFLPFAFVSVPISKFLLLFSEQPSAAEIVQRVQVIFFFAENIYTPH